MQHIVQFDSGFDKSKNTVKCIHWNTVTIYTVSWRGKIWKGWNDQKDEIKKEKGELIVKHYKKTNKYNFIYNVIHITFSKELKIRQKKEKVQNKEQVKNYNI